MLPHQLTVEDMKPKSQRCATVQRCAHSDLVSKSEMFAFDFLENIVLLFLGSLMCAFIFLRLLILPL